jgi:tetratricopeptide (TPR) repeat protein
MLQDFESMLEVCSRAEQYIENNPNYYQEDKLATFSLKKMSAYLHLRDYKKGKVNAEKCLKSFPKGSEIWFTFMEYYLLLAVHTENYINALAILNEAVSNSKFKKLDSITKEKWSIYEAYLHFIIERQSADNPILLKQKRKSFRVNRFINQPVLYPKDQRIFTVLMIVLQILFLIERKNFSAITERIERLKSYANRQLKKEEYYRAIQFIRLLQQLNKADFQMENLSNTTKYQRNLQDCPFFYRGMISELEVIPYEKLWEIMLSYVK